MNIFITGISGLLGLNLAHLARHDFNVSGCYFKSPVISDGVKTFPLDVTNYPKVVEHLQRLKPDLIIHTAGLTNVEACESNPNLAYDMHVVASKHIARASSMLGSRLVHISTDHLFDGESPWNTETDDPEPINNYAKTKLQAEQVVIQECPQALIVRTNFFGWGTSLKASFSDWILRKLDLGEELTMFTDVYFTPILVNQLGRKIFDLVHKNADGIFNVAGSDRLSKYDFALEIARVFGYSTDLIRPISVRDFSFIARRPNDMSLSSTKASDFLDCPMPTTEEGLKELLSLRSRGWPEALAESVVTQSPTSEVVSKKDSSRSNYA